MLQSVLLEITFSDSRSALSQLISVTCVVLLNY